MKNKVTVTWHDGCRKRITASSYSAGGEKLPKGTVIFTDKLPVPDTDDPNNPDKKWIQLMDGWFIAIRYPASEGVERATVETVVVTDSPPTQSEDTVTVTVETSDGKRGSATIILQ